MEKEKDKLQVQQLRPPKLKDKPNRSRLILNLKKVFGFMPEILIIDKVPNESNKIIISAVIPEKSKDAKEVISSKEKDGNNKAGKSSKLQQK